MTGPDKPQRRFTKLMTALAVLWAMVLPLLAMVFAPDLFGTALTGAVPVILGALGGYQTIGHVDLRANLQGRGGAAPVPPPNYQEGS